MIGLETAYVCAKAERMMQSANNNNSSMQNNSNGFDIF